MANVSWMRIRMNLSPIQINQNSQTFLGWEAVRDTPSQWQKDYHSYSPQSYCGCHLHWSLFTAFCQGRSLGKSLKQSHVAGIFLGELCSLFCFTPSQYWDLKQPTILS